MEPLEGRTTGVELGLDGVRFQSGDVENGALDEALNRDSWSRQVDLDIKRSNDSAVCSETVVSSESAAWNLAGRNVGFCSLGQV